MINIRIYEERTRECQRLEQILDILLLQINDLRNKKYIPKDLWDLYFPENISSSTQLLKWFEMTIKFDPYQIPSNLGSSRKM
jgi:hypothetical protein